MAALFFMLFSAESYACSCGHELIVNRVAKADFVANITILKVSTIDTLEDYHQLDIEINELFKGSDRNSILVHSFLRSSCAFLPNEGTTWLVFATEYNNKVSFGYCSGSKQVTKNRWAGHSKANSSHFRSVSIKLEFLDFVKKSGIILKNDFKLDLSLKEKKEGELKGWPGEESEFALFEVSVNEDLKITKIARLKGFQNRRLTRLVKNRLKRSKNAFKWKVSSIKTPTTIHLAFFYYPSENGGESLVSRYDL